MVPNVLMADVYRYRKSKLLYGAVLFTSLLALILVLVLRQDLRFGISIFGDLIAFKQMDDIIRIGAAYHKGLGVVVAILISVFIGQEYQWKTWQHKWIASKSRSSIYLSKAILSSFISVIIFLLFQAVVLLTSGQLPELLTVEYAVFISCSVFLYAALGSVICLIAMLIKNSTASTIVCLGYVLMSETLFSILKNIASASNITAKLAEWGIQHSIFGMSSLLIGMEVSPALIAPILLNSVIIICVSTTIGLLLFRKYEF